MKILPCPFCGGPATYYPLEDNWKMVKCDLCGGSKKEFTRYKKQIIISWNTRLYTPPKKCTCPRCDPYSPDKYYLDDLDDKED